MSNNDLNKAKQKLQELLDVDACVESNTNYISDYISELDRLDNEINNLNKKYKDLTNAYENIQSITTESNLEWVSDKTDIQWTDDSQEWNDEWTTTLNDDWF